MFPLNFYNHNNFIIYINNIKLIFDNSTKIVDNTTMAKIINISAESVIYGQVEIGEEVISFNNRPFEDILDYIYADSLDHCILKIKDKKGLVRDVDVNKQSDFYTLGLEFDNSVEITPKECHNNCIFCFVRQLPKKLRKSLYIRDDDYRLSFISGSYITCTNLEEKDILRIIEYRLSPLYISVHSTNEEIRKKMLGIKQCLDFMGLLKKLIYSGIVIHAQIVLIAGMNDGENLYNSLTDLYNIGVQTVAVVPVGLTNHRQGLIEINPINIEQAKNAIEITEKFNLEHSPFCYCSDEMYQIADWEIPPYDYYGNFDQIENGVGLVSKFLYEFEEALQYAPKHCHRKAGIFTGISGIATMEKVKKLIENKYKKTELNIYPVKNTFFGESVTVTGLITASDIINSYGKNNFDEDYLIIPSVMLKEFETVFLDNLSIEDLGKSLNKKILVSPVSGEEFLETFIYGENYD